MMHWIRSESWSLGIAMVVAVLVWMWAASETRIQQEPVVNVLFAPPASGNWVFDASETSIKPTFAGSKRALQAFTASIGGVITLNLGEDGVPDQRGTHTIDLVSILSRNAQIREAGIEVQQCEPASLTLKLDRLEPVPAEVHVVLPGVERDGDIKVEPREVQISLPSLVRQEFPPKLTVNAIAKPNQVDNLQPGELQTLFIDLEPPDSLAGTKNVEISPQAVAVTFTVKSKSRQTTMNSVRVQLAGPAEDQEDYHVRFQTQQLFDVTIEADADVIRRIQENDFVKVFAFVHISSQDKEDKITSKPVSWLMAEITLPDGTTDYLDVRAVPDPDGKPLTVEMTIEDVEPTSTSDNSD